MSVTWSEDFTHLGLDWSANKVTPGIEGRIDSARKTAYALMGLGLHGNNGLDAATLLKLLKVHVLPRMLYGLDSIILPEKHLNELELFFRRILCQIQGLPDTVANVAVYRSAP